MLAVSSYNELDIAVSKIIEKFSLNQHEASYDPEKFYQYLSVLEKDFFVPKTSITKIVSRLLFAIGSTSPKVMVGAGIYTGHAMAWIAGDQYFKKDSARSIIGLDIDKEAIEKAQENFNKIGTLNVACLNEDAISWIKNYQGEIDLLYIDIDTLEDGKKCYIDVLKAAYPKLKSNALVIAHDINEEKFKNDLVPYIDFTSNKNFFRKNYNLNVDQYGLSVAQKI
ncbi:class I SAM-dependent methyltransferase [Mesobacillus thioparans]|uniref:class I SAM-dependent methyltransferase n=1 Tax=Mesobacillus thioparans TaxID=370439 RepID=UPI0039EF8E13